MSISAHKNVSPMQATSMEIFQMFITYDAYGNVDASGVISKECYNAWLQTRKSCLKNPELTFVQSVRGHITGTKEGGRNPLSPGAEASILKIIRQKKVWPCFQGTKAKYGSRGMNIAGYHEMQHKSQKLEQFDKYTSIIQSEQKLSFAAPLSHLSDADLALDLQCLVDESTDYSRKRASSNPLEYYSQTNKRQSTWDPRCNSNKTRLFRRESSFLLDSLDLHFPSSNLVC
uniref:Uncharacterized protein n=1 Tax=Mucochytrium quahogii TaxID=96639 RepID=A0A7S2RJ50_9STRA|mmetsp:Transcript_15982/g.34572  ORF Transcript_15982/g.34572 Transcript_15982/m.34572 type:complete len:230 (+) Transcript_15982:533-1222(+)